MVIESAVDRIVRILALSIGGGSSVFVILTLPSIIEQHQYLSPAYSVVVYVVYFGLLLGMGALWSRAPMRVLRAMAAVHALSTFVLLVSWVPALTMGSIPGDPQPWLITLVTFSTCTAALVFPFRIAWVFLISVCVTSGIVRFVTFSDVPNLSIAFQDTIMIALFTGVMMTLIQLGRRMGMEQDAAAAQAQRSTVATTAAEALERQRTRYHAFTHDDVLATLNAAARDAPGTETLVRESARQALTKMSEFRETSPITRSLSSIEVDHLLRGAAQQLAFPIEPARMLRGTHALAIPSDVADALVHAAAEAMRNSLRHADRADGSVTSRSTTVEFGPRGVEIIVGDNGRGFVARRIAADRLGVRLSVLQRINSLEGGIATVRSGRGRGTTVTITWAAPPETVP